MPTSASPRTRPERPRSRPRSSRKGLLLAKYAERADAESVRSAQLDVQLRATGRATASATREVLKHKKSPRGSGSGGLYQWRCLFLRPRRLSRAAAWSWPPRMPRPSPSVNSWPCAITAARLTKDTGGVLRAVETKGVGESGDAPAHRRPGRRLCRADPRSGARWPASRATWPWPWPMSRDSRRPCKRRKKRRCSRASSSFQSAPRSWPHNGYRRSGRAAQAGAGNVPASSGTGDETAHHRRSNVNDNPSRPSARCRWPP